MSCGLCHVASPADAGVSFFLLFVGFYLLFKISFYISVVLRISVMRSNRWQSYNNYLEYTNYSRIFVSKLSS